MAIAMEEDFADLLQTVISVAWRAVRVFGYIGAMSLARRLCGTI